MVNANLLRFLCSPDGTAALMEAAALPRDPLTRLTRLRRRYPPEVAAAAVELLMLRDRAAAKFARAQEMFFTAQGLEQSSADVIADWRAGWFPPGVTILDLCCGIGGDATRLGRRGPVFAIDCDPAAARCAAANARVFGASVSVAVADVTRLRLKADAAFFDPSRRSGGRRVRNAERYSPPLSFLHDIRARIPDLAVKLSPALDDATLDSLGGRVEFVSDRGECKEALIWLGGLRPGAPRRATLLPAGHTLESNPEAPPPPITPPGEWLIEPDPAVIRARLIPELAGSIRATRIDPRIAYLTSDSPAETPFAVSYRIRERLPFNLSRIQQRVRALGARITAVKRRGAPMEPDDMARRIRLAGERRLVLVLTRVSDHLYAILCDPPDERESGPCAAKSET